MITKQKIYLFNNQKPYLPKMVAKLFTHKLLIIKIRFYSFRCDKFRRYLLYFISCVCCIPYVFSLSAT